MSQRLIRKHPITGQCVTPIWFDQNGIAVYPIMGAEDTGDGEDGEDGGADSEGQDGTGNDGKGKEEDGDLEAIKKRMQAADRRAAEAERKVKEFEDKDKDEVTKATERAKELEKQVAERDSQIKDLSMKVAFLSANDIDWHDKDVALSHADLSEVLEDDGNVNKKALKKALDDLAKDKPFLVKAKEGDDKKDDLPSGPTGTPAGSGGKKKQDGLSDEELRRKYPALYA